MFFINATNWRKDIAEQILNNDAVMIIDKNKYQQLIGQHQQMQFDNKQIFKFFITMTVFILILLIILERRNLQTRDLFHNDTIKHSKYMENLEKIIDSQNKKV